MNSSLSTLKPRKVSEGCDPQIRVASFPVKTTRSPHHGDVRIVDADEVSLS